MKRKRSVTQGSAQRSRKRISTGNASTSGRNVQTTNSSRTSDQVSTGNARVSRPFWNNNTEEISRRLWLPARTGSATSLLNLSNGSLLSTIQRSWYSVQTSTLMIPNPVSLPRSYYQSLLSSRQDTMGSDQPKIENDEERLKTRKIRIYPMPEEREKLRKWMGTVRWTYNKVLEMVQDDKITDMSVIRERYLNIKCLNEDFLWVKE